MAILPIITVPDKRLKRLSSHVDKVDDQIRGLMDDMLETMYAAPGVGLSAIQVDVPKRIVVVDAAKGDEPKQPIFMVNPEIVWSSEELVAYDEGCLSLPEQYAEILRPDEVKVRFLDYQGELQVLQVEALQARCIQHELDHLEGILFVDHLSAVKRGIIIRKLSKQKRQKAVA